MINNNDKTTTTLTHALQILAYMLSIISVKGVFFSQRTQYEIIRHYLYFIVLVRKFYDILSMLFHFSRRFLAIRVNHRTFHW